MRIEDVRGFQSHQDSGPLRIHCQLFLQWFLFPRDVIVDVIQLVDDKRILDEHDISYAPDRKRFVNPPEYGKASDKYQFMYSSLCV